MARIRRHALHARGHRGLLRDAGGCGHAVRRRREVAGDFLQCARRDQELRVGTTVRGAQPRVRARGGRLTLRTERLPWVLEFDQAAYERRECAHEDPHRLLRNLSGCFPD
eukprot:2664624-Pyramimonas_sp.AAC.2